jgi:serine/threonine protein kinase/Flp pilus assembly protein TadD
MVTPLPTSDADPEMTMIPSAAKQRIFDDTPTIVPTPTAAEYELPVTPTASDAESGALAIGQRFGRYTIVRLLGMGGMGAVYQAWDEELEIVVALKVIRPEAVRDPQAEQEIERRFKRELLLARQVTHKNVVRIHDLGEIDSIKYITMSYVDGIDLATVVREQGQLPVPKALRIIRSVVEGLVAAHAAGVVHRDLKPANIMIDANGKALIMDFGIARSTGGPTDVPAGAVTSAGMSSGAWPSTARRADATMAGTIVGTMEYMAPEQARGEPADQRADVYATGLMLYDLLVGRRRAQRAESAVAELRARMEHALPPVKLLAPDVPNPVAAIVERAIERDPSKRYQTSAELAADFARLDDNGELIPIKRVVRLPWVVAVVTALVVISAGIWWYTRSLIPEAAHEPVSVVIADFENRTNDTAFDNTLGPTLRRGLEDASFISAYDRTKVSALGVRTPEKLDEAAARELALKQALGIVVSGSIEPQRGGFKISVKAIQTVTGKEITSRSATASGKDQVLEVATRLMARVRRALGDKTPESEQLFAMRSVSASSLEVVTYYAAAMEAQAKGNYEAARQSYLKAVELDPKFALGYQGLAAMSRNLGRSEDVDKYVKEALHYLPGLTERERFTTRGFYYWAIGDNTQCVKEHSELLARYPADVFARTVLAICQKNLRNMRSATDEMRQAVKILPNHVILRTNLALFANFSGEFEASEREAKAIAPPSRPSLLALAFSQVGRGLVSEAKQTYEKLAMTDARGVSLVASGVGDALVYEGRFSDAIGTLDRGAAADIAAKSPERAAIKFTSIAHAYLLSGPRGHARAIAAAEKAVENSKAAHVRFLAARIFVDVGALDRAKALAAELSSSSNVWGGTAAHAKIIEGEIALKNGDPQAAIKLLTDANATLDTWFGHFDLGRAHFAAGQFVQADSEFELCINRRGEAISLMDEDPTYGYFPSLYYYQGQVREKMNTAGFADSYRKYLEIRGASTEDPLVLEVRRKLAN